MHRLLNVYATDAVNRYGMRFSVGALVSMLWDHAEIGTPSHLSHDTTRPVGWSHLLAVHFEPGLTRLAGVTLLPETREDDEQLARRRELHLARWAAGHQAEIAELRELLFPHLQGGQLLLPGGTVTLVEPGLAAGAFPDVFADPDKDGLIPLDQLSPVGPGVYRRGPLVFFAHRFLRRSLARSNSLNAPFLGQLQRLAGEGAKVALDTDAVGLASTYRESFEFEYWWGPKFDDDLAAIQPGVAHHHAPDLDRMFHGISGTQFWWHSQGGERTLEVEELRDLPSASPATGDREHPVEYGCRYAHAIVDETTGQIKHFDGAIRVYTEEEMVRRLDATIATAGRHTRYTKLWRIDGAIDVPMWKRLLSDYFRDNRLVGEYLGAAPEDREGDAEEGSEEPGRRAGRLAELAATLVECVPYAMRHGDGVRIALTCQPPSRANEMVREVVPLNVLSSAERQVPVVEAVTIELRKALARRGATLPIPEDATIVHPEDRYANLPLIAHGAGAVPDDLNATLDGIRALAGAGAGRGDDRVLTYSVGFPLEDKEVRVSVLGHVADLDTWLADPLSRPPMALDELRDWADKVSDALDRRYPRASDAPPLAETLMMASGCLSIRRKPIDRERFRFRLLEPDEQGMVRCEIVIPTEDGGLRDAVRSELLAVALAQLVPRSRCSRCGSSYVECDCSTVLDDDVVEEVIEAQVALPFWTDRPA